MRADVVAERRGDTDVGAVGNRGLTITISAGCSVACDYSIPERHRNYNSVNLQTTLFPHWVVVLI